MTFNSNPNIAESLSVNQHPESSAETKRSDLFVYQIVLSINDHEDYLDNDYIDGVFDTIDHIFDRNLLEDSYEIFMVDMRDYSTQRDDLIVLTIFTYCEIKVVSILKIIEDFRNQLPELDVFCSEGSEKINLKAMYNIH